MHLLSKMGSITKCYNYTGFAYRFIDDNALPVVLPAVESFSELVSAYTNNSFKTTKEVRLCTGLLLLVFCRTCVYIHVATLIQQCHQCVLQLVLVLLVVYAIVIMMALTFVMMFLVRRAATSRLRLFSIFTALPRPTILALASQSISVAGGTVLCSQVAAH